MKTGPCFRQLSSALVVLAVLALPLLEGCGSDFTPAVFPTTGAPAEPLGQVFDLQVSLPHLFLQITGMRGLEMEMRLDLSAAGLGQHAARYTVVSTSAAMGQAVEIQDLGGGSTSVTVTSEAWTSSRIGPFQIGTISFELLLDGVLEENGRFVSGQAWESQTALAGSFQGWSRHRFLIAGTDFATAGRLAMTSLVKESRLHVLPDLGAVSGDPVVRRTARAAFVVNRLSFDNVQRLDPDADFATVWQAGMGVGANPHDVLLLPDGRAYVTRYEPPFNDIAIIDAGSGRRLGRIDLLPLAENPDGTPRADRMIMVEGMVFVGLQDIDRTFSRYGEGKLAVIDPLTDEVVGRIPLGGKNPGSMTVLPDETGRHKIYVALAGIFPGLVARELSGGVAVVDVTNRVLERLALDDDDAGGNIGALAIASQDLGYVVVTGADFFNRVLAFDPSNGAILRTVAGSTDLIAEIEVDSGGVLAIPDRSFTRPRLCLFRVPLLVSDPEAGLGCADLDQAPFSLEALD
ncbi:MAG: YncE family protein [Acidobacteriota bacterium]